MRRASPDRARESPPVDAEGNETRQGVLPTSLTQRRLVVPPFRMAAVNTAAVNTSQQAPRPESRMTAGVGRADRRGSIAACDINERVQRGEYE